MWKNLDLDQLRYSVANAVPAKPWVERDVPHGYRNVPRLMPPDGAGEPSPLKFPPAISEGEIVDPKEVALRWVTKLQAWLRSGAKAAPGNILFVGPAKTGKTTLLYATYRQIVEQVGLAQVQVYRVNRLLLAIKAGFSVRAGELEMLDAAAKAVVLGLDDLGSQQNTDWSSSVLEELLDHRCANRLPILFTSNLTLDRLYDEYGHPFMRRVADPEAGDVILEMNDPVVG